MPRPVITRNPLIPLNISFSKWSSVDSGTAEAASRARLMREWLQVFVLPVDLYVFAVEQGLLPESIRSLKVRWLCNRCWTVDSKHHSSAICVP